MRGESALMVRDESAKALHANRSGPEAGGSARGGLGYHRAAIGLPSCGAARIWAWTGRAAVVAPELEQLAAAGVAAVADVPA